MDRLGRRRVEFAVLYPSASRDPLEIAGVQHRAVAHAVAMSQRALQNIRDDLHILMRMLAKTLARRYAILVDDPHRSKAHVPGVSIAGKGEGVIRVEPSVVGVSALLTSSNADHDLI